VWPVRCAAVRLHDVRGERSNVPRWGAGLYGAGKLVTKVRHRIPEQVRSVAVINAVELR